MESIWPLLLWGTVFGLVVFGAAGLRWLLDRRHATPSTPTARVARRQAYRAHTSNPLVPPTTTAPIAAQAAAPIHTEHAQSVPVVRLSELIQFDNLFVIGEKGSGKTTLMRTLAAQLARKRRRVLDGRQHPPLESVVSEEVVIFDPHNAPGKWPGITIGGGSDFAAIGRAFAALHASMRERSREMNRGEREEGAYPGRVLLSDEFFTTNLELKTVDLGRLLLQRLTEGRKFCDAVLVATQNDTAESMGITGNADIKKCFDRWIYLGGFVKSRCRNDAVKAAALQSRFPAVVFNPVTSEWAQLIFDVAPVTQDKRFPLAQGQPVWTRHLVGSFPDVASASSLPSEAVEVPTVTDESLAGLLITPDELIKLGQAVALYLSGEQDKIGAIEQAFTTSRGGKADYKRAVQLFEALGIPPRERRKRSDKEKEAVTA